MSFIWESESIAGNCTQVISMLSHVQGSIKLRWRGSGHGTPSTSYAPPQLCRRQILVSKKSCQHPHRSLPRQSPTVTREVEEECDFPGTPQSQKVELEEIFVQWCDMLHVEKFSSVQFWGNK
jgi:hypothetical protein